MPRGLPRVAWDATAVPAQRGGVGRYVDEVIAALDDAGVPLTVICQARDAEAFSRSAPSAQVVPVAERFAGRGPRLLWEQTVLPGLLRKLAVQVLHSPHYTMPLRSPVPTVVTLHDATFFSDPAVHGRVKGTFFRRWTAVSLRRAAACVVPTHGVVDELVRYAGADPAALTVAHHGVDPAVFHPPDDDLVAAFRAAVGLRSDRWIAFLGTLEPRKNVPALVDGFVAAFADTADPPALVLTGADGWDTGVGPAIDRVPPTLEVIRTGHLPIALLSALLGGSELVCYPTLGEGFGIPVLEAMACGAATLTTRRSPMPEVGGDAVAYTGVDSADIAAAVGELAADPATRRRLSEAGRARAAQFSWTRSAGRHLEVYQRLAGGA